MESIVIEKVWITDSAVWVRTVEGKEAFPRLKYATQKERLNFTLSKDGIHWNDIDEDLSFEGFFANKKTNTLYNLFIAHPELNASAIARRLGISQSLFAQYISGTKTPSAKRMEEILESIRSVGRELASLHVA